MIALVTGACQNHRIPAESLRKGRRNPAGSGRGDDKNILPEVNSTQTRLIDKFNEILLSLRYTDTGKDDESKNGSDKQG